jgi:hypothetical protein
MAYYMDQAIEVISYVLQHPTSVLVPAGVIFLFFSFFELKRIAISARAKPVVPALIAGIALLLLGLVLSGQVKPPSGQASAVTEPSTLPPKSDTPTPWATSIISTVSPLAPTESLTTPQPVRVIAGISLSDGWHLGTLSALGNRVLKDKSLEIDVDGPNTMLGSVLGDIAFSDFVVSVDAKALHLCPGSFGFLFHMKGDDTWYRAAIRTNNQTGYIWSNIGGNYDSLSEWQLPNTFDSYGKHHLQLVVSHGNMTFKVDNIEAENIQDSTIPTGGMALVATAAGDCQYVATFENFSLSIYN